jgi:SAM-dependent methyltransferase
MSNESLKNFWLSEEIRTFEGWDFSYIANRTAEEPLPWNYKSTVLSYMRQVPTMLDMGTGGGEFLLSLDPPRGRTYATESYPPNVERCKRILPLYGIDVRQVFHDDELPFEDYFFDLAINRHESFSPQEVFRVIKPGGTFVTQQVGGQNNRDLAEWLLGCETTVVDPGFDLVMASEQLLRAGFTILKAQEFHPILTFYDVGALVYFAKIIEWEFPGFTVRECFDKLCQLQAQIEKDGFVKSRGHRFFIVAKKLEQDS